MSGAFQKSATWMLCGVASLMLTRAMIALAHRRGWLVNPKADRWHREPTALYGGVAIVSSFFLFACAYASMHAAARTSDMLGLFAGGLVLFVVGLRDDMQPLNPIVKLGGQVLAAMPFLVGLGLQHDSHTFIIGLPLLLFWMVALTNAFNLIDNMNGLSAGTAVIIASLLSVYAFLHGAVTTGYVAALLAASCSGFLFYNFRFAEPARIFMGDCGSMFLGYTLGGLAVLAAVHPIGAPTASVAVPLLLMAIPLFDTSLVIVRRKREGRAISMGGKDHSSHRLVYAGLDEKHAVLTLFSLTAASGGAALVIERMHQPILLASGVVAAAALLAPLGAFLSRFPGPVPTRPVHP